MTRKEIKKYFFSVEGETEKWYLKWLEKTINSTYGSKFFVSFDVKVEKSPIRRVKKISTLKRINILHVIDYEETANDRNFQSSLDHMKEAEKLKDIKYNLGYSNYTFDLWIILHKKPLLGSMNHRNDYLREINKAYHCSFESLAQYKEETNFKKILDDLKLEDVKKAIDNAQIIKSKNEANGYTESYYRNYSYYKNNPSLNLHEYIKKILEEVNI